MNFKELFYNLVNDHIVDIRIVVSKMFSKILIKKSKIFLMNRKYEFIK